MIIKDFKLLFKRNASASFYYYEQFNMGAAYLMTNAHFKLPNLVDLVSKSDMKIHLKIKKSSSVYANISFNRNYINYQKYPK